MLYLVLMYRWGDRENHSYPLGVFDNLEETKVVGKFEKEYRGNKYDPFYFSGTLNIKKDWKLLDEE
ncbi:MAG: hypothetical protein GQ540_03795 [Lutibacter sp.]|uniref:hypothetical protein n=1 Tax=Lutibacter sp. TaxID=1925666 RepID=UPI0019DA6519|nr:hypothetical protein [Lutibacter sp.]NOR27636.1 hypothetical protein [Lutibacter sp.]